MLPQELIRKKRDGAALTADEIRDFIAGVTDGSIPDYQAAAMLMAVFFRGFDERELAAWADAMVHSGDVLDMDSVGRPIIDKHSTGGVGDKISLPLAPAVAACGLAVPMISGRGLGHTGGTLDKLESIPGFRIDLPVDRFIAQVRELGVALIGQTDRLAPADRRLYPLRDVTATIESIPLIASSIMSKKIAAGIDGLVLDIKVGGGAFMRTRVDAIALGRAIRTIGDAAGVKVTAVLTAMDTPIGRNVGNALEVLESIEVLRGRGPADTRELTVRLGAEMLLLGGVSAEPADAERRVTQALDSGAALDLFRRVVAAQGGDPRAVDEPEKRLPRAPQRAEVVAAAAGFVQRVDARDVGLAALHLGAGRRTKEDAVDPAVGIEMLADPGDQVAAGQPLAILHHAGKGVADAQALMGQAFALGPEPPAAHPLILEVLR
jgi:pyrimidine-nucleoside phosphorylase